MPNQALKPPVVMIGIAAALAVVVGAVAVHRPDRGKPPQGEVRVPVTTTAASATTTATTNTAQVSTTIALHPSTAVVYPPTSTRSRITTWTGYRRVGS